MVLELVNKFRVLCSDLCALIETEGLVIRPYHLESLPYFCQLSVEDQQAVIESLSNYISICHSLVDEGQSLRESRNFVNRALDFYGYSYDESVLTDLPNEDLVEIYSFKHTQLFRTLSFFEYASYTVEDVYCRIWLHLYDRDPAVSARLFSLIEPILNGSDKTVVSDVEEHLLVEKASLERLAVNVLVKVAAPLIKNGRVEAYMVVARCRPILTL